MRIISSDNPIVWWDPAVLELDVEEEASLRQQRILESDKDGAAAGFEARVLPVTLSATGLIEFTSRIASASSLRDSF
jgi:hypothetical protein